jgi:AraC-like DNA-binding protein/ligand-binding sensor protein
MSNLVEALAKTSAFEEYAKAFTALSGLPFALYPPVSWQLSLHGKRNEARYCALLARNRHACASCLQLVRRLSRLASDEAHTVHCPSRLCVTAVPIRVRTQLIGFLQTGQVFCTPPAQAQFRAVSKQLKRWGLDSEMGELREAYFAVKVVPWRKYQSLIKLLKIFARQLSMAGQTILTRQEHADVPLIERAKEYIRQHQREKIRLGIVARARRTSMYYFGKRFKQETGLSFPDYVARVRVEESRNLLLNPNLPIKDIASEVGFKSVKHFSRVFKRIVGRPPGAYRALAPMKVRRQNPAKS